MSATAIQLTMTVIPVNSKHSIHNGCIVTPITGNKVDPVLPSSELCDGAEGAELSILTINTLRELG